MAEPNRIHAEGGSISAGTIHGDVHLTNAAPAPRTTIEQLLSRNRFDAAEWLRATDRDEAVHLLAAAPVEIAAELLDVMLGRDPARVVELLAAGEHGRARQVVAAMADGGGPVADVAEAAQAVLRHAATHPTGSGLGARQGGLRRAAPSPRGTTGYYWIFANGVISWCARGGARTTMGPVLAFHNQRAGSAGYLGFALSDEVDAAGSPGGTSGRLQRFEFFRDFAPDVVERIGTTCGATVYYSQAHGPHATRGRVGEYHERQGGTSDWLGFPVSGEEDVAGVKRQRFEGGVVYRPASGAAIGVRSDIAAYHETQGGAEGPLGVPAGEEWSFTLPDGAEARGQRFEAGGRPDAATVYVYDCGTFHVWAAIGELYDRLGGAVGPLGLPTTSEIDGRYDPDQPWRCFQEFDGGVIFWSEGHGAIVTSNEVCGLVEERTGFPISPERELVDADGVRTGEMVQFFERAVITVRDGTARAWLTGPSPDA